MLSVILLDCWYFNTKCANCLHDCYNQFLWSSLFLFNWPIWLLFTVILLDLLRSIPLVFYIVPLYSWVNSYLVPYLNCLTFFQPFQLVVVVVGFCLHFLSTMLNACVISSFKHLVSLIVCPIFWPGLVSTHIRISTLSFDPGLQCFLVPFHLGSQ